MTGRFIFTVADGNFDALVFKSGSADAQPGLLIAPEVFGRSEHMRAMAGELAQRGFVVGILDLHWRLEAQVALEPAEVERARSLHQRLDYELALGDIAAAVEQFRSLPECSGAVGVVGFCLGGTLAWLAAARSGADACVSYYPTRVTRYIDEARQISRPLLMHLGADDQFTPPNVVTQIESATRDNSLVELYVYANAGHAFCNPAQSGFNSTTANLAQLRSLEFLQAHLR